MDPNCELNVSSFEDKYCGFSNLSKVVLTAHRKEVIEM